MMKKIILTLSFILVSTFVFAGGPWVQKKNKGYFKISEWWVVFDQHYTDIGKIDPNTTTGIFNTYAYAEYGVSDRFTVIFNGAVFSRNYMNSIVSKTTNETLVKGEEYNGIGDIDIGLKYGITKAGSKIPLAVSVNLGLPTGATAKGTERNLQTGDGEFNQSLTLHGGKGFKVSQNISGYVAFYSGINNRTNKYSEEFRFGGEVGLGLLKNKVWVIYRTDGVESFKNGATADMVSSTSVFANNTEYISSSFEINGYITKKIGLSIGTAGAFRGEIIAARPSYSVGVFYDFSK